MSTRSRSAPLNLLFALHAHAVHRARDVAVVDDTGEHTFAELWDTAAHFAGRLRASGIAPGATVAIAMDGSAGYLAALLGTLLAGAAAAPLNTALAPPELAAYLDLLRPEMTVAGLDFLDKLPATVELLELGSPDSNAPLLEQLGLARRPFRPYTGGLRRPPGSRALLFPTGGTTGLPKAAILTHQAVVLWAMSLAGHGRAGIGIDLCASPFFHVTLLTGPLSTLHAGARVVVQRTFDAELAVRHILEDGVTRIQTVPTVLRRLREIERFDEARLALTQIRFGGMGSSPDFIDELLELFPNAQLSTSYGATEFGPVTGAFHGDFLRGRRSGVGRPLPGVRIRIEGEGGEALEPGQQGAIVVQCAWQASGYVGRPEESAATFTASGVRLADCGSIDDDGWLTLLGRQSEMLITGGENVFPSEVEAVLARHPDVADVLVIGAPDPTWGERLEAVVVSRPGTAVTVDSLRSFARGQLASYKLPRSARQVDAIPLTANNKPDRRALLAASLQAERQAG